MSHIASEQDKAAAAQLVGIYVHVPFCASTCDFCAFYQTKPTADGIERFLAGVATEANLIDWPSSVATVFWGGGTPGLLAPRDLGRLANDLRSRCAGNPAEWTVELAPASVTPQRLAVLREVGVTRISMGVQSFQPALLEGLGRQHSCAQIYRAYDLVRAAAFESVNLDLMFALPGQSEDQWRADLKEAVRLAPDHLSTYCLTFEEDTALWIRLSGGRAKLDLEREACLYESTWSFLAEHGYAQYEVSNFSRPGHQCLHNLNTWRMQEWLGLGPSAASQYAGVRGSNIADLEQWLARVAQGRRMTEDRLALTPLQLAEDALVFGLRMNEGVDVNRWRARCPEAPWEQIESLFDRLAEEGFCLCDGAWVRLTDRGRLLVDTIGGEVLEAFRPTVPL